jgi:hypothetical protein
MEILAPLLRSHWSGALLMADRAQLTRGDYVVIFKQGLAEANASSIKLWMKATVGYIGWRKVISILRDVAAPWPFSWRIRPLPHAVLIQRLSSPSIIEARVCKTVGIIRAGETTPILACELEKPRPR